MPNKDQTGPEGEGPKTGRKQGRCGSSTKGTGCGPKDGTGRGLRRKADNDGPENK